MEKYRRAGQGTDDSMIQRMRIACWIPKAKSTRSEYVILIACPLHQWLNNVCYCYVIRILPVLFSVKHGDIYIYICTHTHIYSNRGSHWRSWLMSRVRFPMASLELFIDITLPAALFLGGVKVADAWG